MNAPKALIDALKAIIDLAPRIRPTEEEHNQSTDAEAAYFNGAECSAWDAAEIARKALAAHRSQAHLATRKMKRHDITISVAFDAPVTKREAWYAVWNSLSEHNLWGEGKPRGDEPRSLEPFGKAKIMVKR